WPRSTTRLRSAHFFVFYYHGSKRSTLMFRIGRATAEAWRKSFNLNQKPPKLVRDLWVAVLKEADEVLFSQLRDLRLRSRLTILGVHQVRACHAGLVDRTTS